MNVAGLALAGGVAAGIGMTFVGDRVADEIHDTKSPALSAWGGIIAAGGGVGAAKIGMEAALGAGMVGLRPSGAAIGMIVGGAVMAGLGIGMVNSAYVEQLDRQS